MKTRSVPRVLAVLVLTLTFAASAPIAWAGPAATSGSQAVAWDLGPVFTWLQAFVAEWFGGLGQGGEMERIAGQAGNILEPDGITATGELGPEEPADQSLSDPGSL